MLTFNSNGILFNSSSIINANKHFFYALEHSDNTHCIFQSHFIQIIYKMLITLINSILKHYYSQFIIKVLMKLD